MLKGQIYKLSLFYVTTNLLKFGSFYKSSETTKMRIKNDFKIWRT